MKTEQGRAEIEAEFYKRFEAADANCNNRLSLEEWFEFTEGYKVGREQRREKFVEKTDEQLEEFWKICDKINHDVDGLEEDDRAGISMEEIEAVFRHCAKIIIESSGLFTEETAVQN